MFTLMVSATNFVETVKRHSSAGSYPAVYTLLDGQAPAVTAAFPERNFMVVGIFGEDEEVDMNSFRAQLESEGLHVFDGIWDVPRAIPPVPSLPTEDDFEDEYFTDMEDGEEEFFVASVGFVTPDAAEPYLWTDIYPYQPTEEEVMEDLLAWMEENDELRADSIAEFRERFPTNILITSSTDMKDW